MSVSIGIREHLRSKLQEEANFINEECVRMGARSELIKTLDAERDHKFEKNRQLVERKDVAKVEDGALK